MKAIVKVLDDDLPGRYEDEIPHRVRTVSMAEKWTTLERLAVLNAAKERARAASLSLEESARLFEELCTLFHTEFDGRPPRKEHPVGLIKYWKKP